MTGEEYGYVIDSWYGWSVAQTLGHVGEVTGYGDMTFEEYVTKLGYSIEEIKAGATAYVAETLTKRNT
jgi:hypothetical protein